MDAVTAHRVRRSFSVRGIVQGVGFRPFVHALARRFQLGGFVRNETGGVRIEIEGDAAAVDNFGAALRAEPPPLAHIEAIECAWREPSGATCFEIEASEPSHGSIRLAPDVATCDDCLRELFDRGDRRHRYPFINCTSCGPRLSIICRAPYDRAATTMARFTMCATCDAEYRDPRDRRFHAQPNACAACGPALALHDVVSADPLRDAVCALRAGAIVAIKGLGGFHLACDATNADAVAALRLRKHRDEKPFAVMVRDLAAAERIAVLAPAERIALASRERPIVLVERASGGALAENVAPGSPLVGIMLAYTPLHALLLHDVDGLPLVMTSGNRSDEPIAYEDDDAIERLRGIADLILTHDRPIQTRCDDSVVRVVAGQAMPLRRSRGYTPRTLALPSARGGAILALGGHLKAAFAFGGEGQALLGHHIGDLDDHRAYESYVDAIAHYERVFELRPRLLVHDLHPDYGSTRYALERGGPRVAVQHHHAHIASCMAEHGLDHRVIGVAFDGSGYGTDGRIWGGEFLVASLPSFTRAAHLRYVALPGGESAIREPWRMALSYLVDANRMDVAERLLGSVPREARRVVHQMIERDVHCVQTSSMGRLFDAVAALAGVRTRTTFEGQAAMELELLAMRAAAEAGYRFEIREGLVDARPVIEAVVRDRLDGVGAERIARRFHTAVIELVVAGCLDLRATTGIADVVLGGGVFQNAIVTAGVEERLHATAFRVYRPRHVPPNDGGLALGQLAIAAAREAS